MPDNNVDKTRTEREESSVDSYDVSNCPSYDAPRSNVRRRPHPSNGSGYPHYPQPYYYPFGNAYFGQHVVEYPDYQTGMMPYDMSPYQLQQQQHMMMQQQQYYAAVQQQQYQMMQYQQQHFYMHHHQQQQPLHLMQAMTMEELKQYVMEVDASDVKTVIRQALFSPRQMAFTSLMQIAGKSKQTDKAVAIFEAMKEISTLKPNTFSYTALISALARVGDWRRAEEYFKEMKDVAKADANVSPNRVTFSSMISVYDKANKFDMAIKTYKEQLDAKIQPDLITYASILTACQRAGNVKHAVEIMKAMHSNGLVGPLQLYNNLLAECSEDWESALEILAAMQQAEVTATSSTLNLAMIPLYAGDQKDHAVFLMKKADDMGLKMSASFYDMVLGLCSDHGDFTSADETYTIMLQNGVQLSGHSAGLVLSAHMQGGDDVESIQVLNIQFESRGITPVLPVKQEVVEHNASPAAKVVSNINGVVNTVSMTAASLDQHSDVTMGNVVKGALPCDRSVANLSLGSTQSEIDVSQSVDTCLHP